MTDLADDKGYHLSESVDVQSEAGDDWFVSQKGVEFAGTHLLLEFWEASTLDDETAVEQALVRAAEAAGATVLDVRLHTFLPSGGVTGVLLLAESHISIHTWPERAYAAIDVFMCGNCNPHHSVPVLEEAFQPGRMEVSEHKRGKVEAIDQA